MGRFTKIPSDAFDKLQLDAGVLLKTFDPANPQIAANSIICATTGGINVSCVPTYSDFAEDVDNAPINVKEFKHLDSWECKISTTGLGTSPELIKLALGAADIPGTNTSKIVPRRSLSQSDFSDLWWVGDKANGGYVAVKLMNALSTGGFTIQTTKNGKGQVSLEITGHVALANQDVVPMEFYSSDDQGSGAVSVAQTLVHVTSDFDGGSASTSSNLVITLTADTGYTVESVIVLCNGVDITDDAWASATGKVTIASADLEGPVEIIATANANS